MLGGKVKTTIEINGRIYDAKTGKVITAKADTTANVATDSSKNTSSPNLQRGVVMDGVSKIRPSDTSMMSAKTRPSANRPKANHATIKPQKSKTLIRKAVHKPAQKKEPTTPVVHSTSANMNTRVEKSATGRGLLLKRVPDVRLMRAKHFKKSEKVQKFTPESHPKAKVTPELTVKPAPVSNPISHATSLKTSAPAAAPSIAPPVPSQTSKKTSVFEDWLYTANSHLQKPVTSSKKKRSIKIPSVRISPKIISVSAAAFAILLLGGFFAYQNVPAVSMRVAANEAGFMGKLPKSIPAGYAFDGPVQAEPANITLVYSSNSDDRQFVITQKPTNWSSEGLLTNYLVDSKFRYQAYKDKGLTVYIYNGSNATWVDKGVWFSVKGDDGSLSAEQLLDIAANI